MPVNLKSLKNLSYIRTEEHRQKMSLVKTGKKRKPFSDEWKKRLSESKLGRKRKFPMSEEAKRKISLANSGKKRTEEMNEKRRGKNHWGWKGGKTCYPQEFNKALKAKIRIRDNFTCCLCGRTEREELEELNRVLCVNHIDFNKNNCKENNLNTLCLRCNVKINREREYWADYFINKL